MIDDTFTTGWTAGPKRGLWDTVAGTASPHREVDLPHDYAQDIGRSESAASGTHTGYHLGGSVEYNKTFEVPLEYEHKKLVLQFDGVYRDAMVFVNDVLAAQRPNGYSRFFVDLDKYLVYGQGNRVRVEARAHEDSRWYTGIGIHRDVKLHVLDRVHIEPHGVRVHTPDIDPQRAIANVATSVRNSGLRTVTASLHTEIVSASGDTVASDRVPVTVPAGDAVVARGTLYVPTPELWSPDSPTLYSVRTVLSVEGRDDQHSEVAVGIRQLQLDAHHGLRINGVETKLRGACVHHDNGILGARALPEAEERRVRILKESGFNAIRSSHNPMSEPMLEACDRLGMLVMDETFDIWTEAKTPFDYSLAFSEWWERDLESMVAKDFNHPSVIFYSIGNEIPETGTPLGSNLGRQLAEKIRELDPTRFTTNGVNGIASTMREISRMMPTGGTAAEQGVNDAMSGMADMMKKIDPFISARIDESLSVVDAAGLNYGETRYLADRETHPDRVIIGTETYPDSIAENWEMVTSYPHLIGDFTWTGWDYLGEAGLGRVEYEGNVAGRIPTAGAYPWLLAWCGDIDITGLRRPASFYREIVFGLRERPYIAVQRPVHHGQEHGSTPWSWSDSVSTWSWSGLGADAVTTVEVYSAAAEVELLLNGRSLGSRETGAANKFRATFEVPYEPGELLAIARTDDVESGRSLLLSAPTADTGIHLDMEVESGPTPVVPGQLLFIAVSLRDAAGAVVVGADRSVSVTASGTGTALAFGSAAPATTERYDAMTHPTFDGRALFIVRADSDGDVHLTAVTDGVDGVDGVELVIPISIPEGR